MFLLTIFFAYILFEFLLPDYFVKQKNLVTDKGIIQNVFKNKYLTWDKAKGKYYASCIDIILVDKPYFIRFSDDLVDHYWGLLNDTNNISRQVEVKFQNRLLRGNILHNPNQISIDSKVIIRYNAKQTFIGWAAVAMTFVIIICLFFIYKAYRIYKTSLFGYHKKV